MSKRMTDRERLKLAMDQPDTIGGTDWIGWLEIVIREMNKDADHIRELEARLARLVDWLETLDGHPLPNHIETILKEARNG